MTFQQEKDIFHCKKLFADAVIFADAPLNEKDKAALEAAFADSAVAAAALRTVPFESAYYCNPVTMETDFALNGAFAVKADALAAVGGADTRMGVYAACELIARLKAEGYKTVYCPRAEARLSKSLAPPYADRLFDGALFRKKCGSKSDEREAFVLRLKALKHPDAYGIGRGEWIKRELSLTAKAISLAFGGEKNRRLKNSVQFENGAEAGLSRGEYISGDLQSTPLVSLVTRTRNRPETLRKTLESLRNQTYDNFEVVVVEDGEPLSERMIKEEFGDLRITYRATVENIGRAAAANLGFSLAKGEFLNLLDDDDYLLPEHIELGVGNALSQQADVVFLKGIALESNRISEKPYKIEVVNKNRLDFPRIEPFTMVRRCVTTQNGVMFRRALCNEVGGMREELGAHEDWNLFLRLMTKGKYTVVPYACCCYVVPADREAERKRLEEYSKYDKELLKDETLVFTVGESELEGYRDSVTDDYEYLLSLGLAGDRIAEETARRAEFYGDGELMSFEEARENGFPLVISGEKLRELYFSEVDLIAKSERDGALGEYLSSRRRKRVE